MNKNQMFSMWLRGVPWKIVIKFEVMLEVDLFSNFFPVSSNFVGYLMVKNSLFYNPLCP